MLNEIDRLIDSDFNEIREMVSDIVQNSVKTDQAAQEIVNYVSGKLTASWKGYTALLYSEKSKETLGEDIFKSDENANKFYGMNLRQKIADSYQFNVADLRSLKAGIDFKETNELCGPTAIKAAVGSGVIAGAMLGLLSSAVHIPLAAVIAGSLVAGIGGGVVANKIVVPQQNKRQFEAAVQKFLDGLKPEVRQWVHGLERYYDDQVSALKKELEGGRNAG